VSLYHDPRWPRASAWLAGECLRNAVGTINVLGLPMAKGSITPGRCDLAPAAIRKALERFSTYDFDSDRDLRLLAVKDEDDLNVSSMMPELAFQPVAEAVALNVEAAPAVVLLGGDNSITRPGCHGLGLPLSRCGLLTLDAHLDLRDLEGGLTNGNPVRALLHDGLPGDHIFQIGIQPFANSEAYARVAREAGIHVITADCVMERGAAAVVREALEYLDQRTERIYVDLDLDVLDRVFAPATPGSRPGGLAPHLVRKAAHICGAHPKVRVLDLVEMDPTHDVGEATALAAAACLLEFASGVLGRFTRV
jgi:formiminoglutamase